MNLKFILFSVFLTTILNAELYWSGQINIPYNFYLKSYKNTQNNLRIINFNANYGMSNIEFKSTAALEYKWDNGNYNPINFREYYLSYYPDFGEISIGKQIISWGIADGNNPTDNINPYNLNYMFDSWVERKIGIHSISSTVYYNDIKMNLILSYDKVKNIKNQRLPFPLPENGDESNFEYGLDFQYNLNQAEFNISYLVKKNIPILKIPDFNISESNVHVIGLNLLYIYDEITMRMENAIFLAKNNEKFYQGIFQLEFPPIFDFTIGSQLFGTHNIKNSAKGIYSIGSPIFLLTDTSPLLVTSLSRLFNDDTIELKILIMSEILDGYGSSLGTEITYNITDNLKTSINYANFLKGNSQSTFNNLSNYSNIKLSLNYFF